MSYYRICPNCGKGTVARYATDDSLCGECSDNSSATDKLSVEKLQERCDRYEKALTEITNIPESDNYFDCEECIFMMEESAKQALAAIGEDDDFK